MFEGQIKPRRFLRTADATRNKIYVLKAGLCLFLGVSFERFCFCFASRENVSRGGGEGEFSNAGRVAKPLFEPASML